MSYTACDLFAKRERFAQLVMQNCLLVLCAKRLVDIGNKVADVFEADGKAHHVGGHASSGELLIAHLAVG